MKIKMDSVEHVKEFVKTVVKYQNDFDLVNDRYVIDAKSILGIMTMDLKQPIELVIHGNENSHQEIIQELERFRYE